jgi:NADH:ubiquinone oxidoreductase subunit 2 (subunit N)
MSVVSAGYYLRIVRSMFAADESSERARSAGSVAAQAAVVGTAALVLALGLAAGPLLTAVGATLP